MSKSTSQSERELQGQVAEYIAIKYPRTAFHADYGSGLHMSKGQAAVQRRQQGGRRGWPDLFVATPVFSDGHMAENLWWGSVQIEDGGYEIGGVSQYISLGLFIELKREGTRIRKMDGSYASAHIAEQAAVMDELKKVGYSAGFACGFAEAREIIDFYMREKLLP